MRSDIISSAKSNDDIPESAREDISTLEGAIDAMIRYDRGSYQREFVTGHPHRNGKTISAKSSNIAGEDIYWGKVADRITAVKLGPRED
jgi:hypothetical protein